MNIITQFSMGKSPDKRSEDGLVVTPDFVAVIDGSTSKSRLRCHRELSFRKHSNGELAMLVVASVVRKLARDASCRQFCTLATQAIRSHYRKSLLSHLATHPEDRLTASCIVFSRMRRELWLVGDCQALVNGQLIDNPKPSEALLARERADIITASADYQQWKASGQPLTPQMVALSDRARQAIIPHMLRCMQQQNRGYSVLDGFPVDHRHVVTVSIDFSPKEIVLASDGYPFLCPTLEESEQRLQQQRQCDPLNIGPHFQATKAFLPGSHSFDDRTYVRFSV